MTIAVGTLPRRTAEQLRSFVRAQQVEVERHPEDVAPASAAGSTYWRYLVGRTPLEGICVYYQTYDASGDENDWNLNIAPASAYTWLLDPPILQALSLFSGAPHLMEPCSVKCKEGYQVIEAELTPDDGLYDKFVTGGLPISSGSWPPNKDENQGEGPTGKRVGVYGVFCGDYGHGGRPEIHPFDAFWRQRHRDERAASMSWDLGVFQDDSNRFNSDWSRSPIDVEVRIPFCVDVPVTMRTATTARADFVVGRSDLCSVVGRNTRAAGAPDLTETFTARTVRLNPRLENRLEVTVRDVTGVAGRPFVLGFDDLSLTTVRSLGLFRMHAWLAGRIVVRVAVEQDGFAYWNLRGPNSTTAADAKSDDSFSEAPGEVARDPVLTVATERDDGARMRAPRIIEAAPRVSLAPSPSIAVEVRTEMRGGDGGARVGHVTVRPRETPWLLDESTGRWSELESFDLFAMVAVEGASELARPGRAQRRSIDITAAIGRLAGLERFGQRIRAPDATVEIDDELVISLRSFYVPYRDGEAMGEERSLVTDRLSEIDTGPTTVRADVWVTEADGRSQRHRIGRPDEHGSPDASPVKLEGTGDRHRLIVSGLAQRPVVVRLDASIEDEFGLRSDVAALAANFSVADARPWVESVCGVSLDVLRGRLDETARAARLAPTDSAIAAVGMLRTLVAGLSALGEDAAVSATRVAGVVRLCLRVQELLDGHAVGRPATPRRR